MILTRAAAAVGVGAAPSLGWAGLGLGWAPGRGKKGRRAGLAASPLPAIADSRARFPAVPRPTRRTTPPFPCFPSLGLRPFGIGGLIFGFILFF